VPDYTCLRAGTVAVDSAGKESIQSIHSYYVRYLDAGRMLLIHKNLEVEEEDPLHREQEGGLAPAL